MWDEVSTINYKASCPARVERKHKMGRSMGCERTNRCKRSNTYHLNPSIQDFVHAAAFAPSGRALALAGEDCRMRQNTELCRSF